MPAGRPRSTTLTRGDWTKAVKKWERVVARISEYCDEQTPKNMERVDKAIGVNCSFCARFENEDGSFGCDRCPLSPKFCHVENVGYPVSDLFHKMEHILQDEDATESELLKACAWAQRILEKIEECEPTIECPFKVGDEVVSLGKRAWIPRKGKKGKVLITSDSGDVNIDWGDCCWWTCEEPYVAKYIALAPTEKFPRPKGRTPHCRVCGSIGEWNPDTGHFYCSSGGKRVVIETPKPRVKKTPNPKKPKVDEPELEMCTNGLHRAVPDPKNPGYMMCTNNNDHKWPKGRKDLAHTYEVWETVPPLKAKKVKKTPKPKKPKTPKVECPVCENMCGKETDTRGYVTCPVCESEFLV